MHTVNAIPETSRASHLMRGPKIIKYYRYAFALTAFSIDCRCQNTGLCDAEGSTGTGMDLYCFALAYWFAAVVLPPQRAMVYFVKPYARVGL